MKIEEKEYSSEFDLKIWKRLLPFFKPFYKTFAIVLFFNLVCALIDIMLPLFQRYAVDEFIEAGTVEHIWEIRRCLWRCNSNTVTERNCIYKGFYKD